MERHEGHTTCNIATHTPNASRCHLEKEASDIVIDDQGQQGPLPIGFKSRRVRIQKDCCPSKHGSETCLLALLSGRDQNRYNTGMLHKPSSGLNHNICMFRLRQMGRRSWASTVVTELAPVSWDQ